MVIKSKLYDILKKYIGEYLYGFEKDQLEVALLSGNVYLRNVNFKPSKVNDFLVSHGLPFHIKAGLIGELKFKCHFTALFSNPLELFIDELLLIFGPITMDQSEPPFEQTDSFSSDENRVITNPSNQTQEEEKGEILIEEEDMSENDIGDDEARPIPPVQSIINNTKRDFFREEEKSKAYHSLNEGTANGRYFPDEEIKGNRHLSKPGTKNPTFSQNNYSREEERAKTPPVHSYEATNARRNQEQFSLPTAPQRKESFVERYFHKVFRNLTLHIKKVHIRYEDDIYPYQHPFACGLCMDTLDIRTSPTEFSLNLLQEVEKKPPAKNSTAKSIQVSQLGLYIDSMAGMLIPTSLWEATLESPIGIFSALPAGDVRNMIMDENGLAKDLHSSILAPIDFNASLTIPGQDSAMKFCALFGDISIRFSSAMAECCRNFCEYYSNVQLWGCIRIYRPYEKLLAIPKTPEEPSNLTAKRFKIVQKWFRYSLKFVREKRRLILFIRNRREEINKIYENEKHKKLMQGLRDIEKAPEEPPAKLSKNGNKSSLRAVVNQYNQRKNETNEKKPYNGELYFHKLIQQSEIQVKANEIGLVFFDEDSGIQSETELFQSFVSLKFMLDELNAFFELGEATFNIRNEETNTKILQVGKRDVIRHEVVKEGLFRGNRTHIVRERGEKALSIRSTFRPGEVKEVGESWPNANRFDINTVLSQLHIHCSEKKVEHCFGLVESFKLDRAHRERMDVEFINSLLAKKENKLTNKERFVLQNRRIMQKKALTQYILTHKFVNRLVELKEQLPEKIDVLNYKIFDISFNSLVDLAGINLNLSELSSDSLLSLGKGRVHFKKNKRNIEVGAYQLSAHTQENLQTLYDHFSGMASILAIKASYFSQIIDLKQYR